MSFQYISMPTVITPLELPVSDKILIMEAEALPKIPLTEDGIAGTSPRRSLKSTPNSKNGRNDKQSSPYNLRSSPRFQESRNKKDGNNDESPASSAKTPAATTPKKQCPRKQLVFDAVKSSSRITPSVVRIFKKYCL